MYLFLTVCSKATNIYQLRIQIILLMMGRGLFQNLYGAVLKFQSISNQNLRIQSNKNKILPKKLLQHI